eukprot:CAMPEP_0184873792 /NCGR_PEP_ID=MMETSP0580-20130426/42036_1 /TAXON_ID=1118495 /ORGANISM="Dactyliosolen fragilissimus" /LENGTH=315 /DNA_ID=CAMNT_0027376731 /DNA_START=17 /DNA_END=961 /DNA_ORIENTATION=+
MSSSSSSRKLLELSHLKKSLKKQLDFSSSKSDESLDVERCLEVFAKLESYEFDLDLLSKSLIGTIVSKFKSNGNAEISSKAKALIKKWKQIAKREGVTQKATNSYSSTSIETEASASASASASDESEWDGLPTFRQNCCKKLHQTLQQSKDSMIQSGVHADAFASLSTSRCTEVESEIQSYTLQKNCPSSYTDKIRSLIFNLRKNSHLRENVLTGSTSAHELVRMSSDQLATAEKGKERSKLISDLQDSRRLDWEQANESKINEMCGIKGDLLKASLFTCGRCKSVKTTSTQKQTRSADEPMTVFVLCLNCGNRW